MSKHRGFHQPWSNQSFSSSGPLGLGALKVAKVAAAEERTIVLVEGLSDKLALNALAERLGRNLDAEGITTIAIDGATNIGYFLNLLGPHGMDVKPLGLCDVQEERYFQAALERAGFGSDISRTDMESLGFYICHADLEDELIRSLGVDAVIEVAAAQGELGAFRTFQRQPAWKKRGEEAQLRRWLGTTSQRKFRYAMLLVDALNLDHIPVPLDRLLTHISYMD